MAFIKDLREKQKISLYRHSGSLVKELERMKKEKNWSVGMHSMDVFIKNNN